MWSQRACALRSALRKPWMLQPLPSCSNQPKNLRASRRRCSLLKWPFKKSLIFQKRTQRRTLSRKCLCSNHLSWKLTISTSPSLQMKMHSASGIFQCPRRSRVKLSISLTKASPKGSGPWSFRCSSKSWDPLVSSISISCLRYYLENFSRLSAQGLSKESNSAYSRMSANISLKSGGKNSSSKDNSNSFNLDSPCVSFMKKPATLGLTAKEALDHQIKKLQRWGPQSIEDSDSFESHDEKMDTDSEGLEDDMRTFEQKYQIVEKILGEVSIFRSYISFFRAVLQ